MPQDPDDPRGAPRRPRHPPAPTAPSAKERAAGQAPPRYTRYRSRPRLPGEAEEDFARLSPRSAGGSGARPPARPRNAAAREPRGRAWWRRLTWKRGVLLALAAVLGWLLLSLVLFLLSAQFNRQAPPGDVKSVLAPAGFPLTSANNILVLGSDRRQKNSREPGANTSGPSRSDVMMLIRTGGGHAARLSIPRDTVVEIPGHGLQKINAAYAFGGPALSISVVAHYLNIPINHLVEVNFEDFPQLIDSMGGVNYSGGCVISRVDGGFANGGFTLRLKAGAHHLDGREALALARTRENLCAPRQTDLDRAKRQQALFQDMKSRLLSPSAFVRLPWISWNAPPAIISDMSGPTLLGLFAALAANGTPPTRILNPSGTVALPDGEVGLSVSEAQRRAAAAHFLAG